MQRDTHPSTGGCRILGIDPGSRVVGFACLEALKSIPRMPQDFMIIDAGVFRVNPDRTHVERLGHLHEALFKLAQKLNPDICAIEKAFTGINAMSALKLGEARGALIAALKRLKVPINEITPAQVKRIIAGTGRATKEDMSRAVQTFLKLDRGGLPYDVTDAAAIALCYGLSLSTKIAMAPRSFAYAQDEGRTSQDKTDG